MQTQRQPQWEQQERREEKEKEIDALMHTGLTLVGQQKRPGKMRLWLPGNYGFADVIVEQEEDGTMKATNLHRSAASRLAFGSDIQVQFDE